MVVRIARPRSSTARQRGRVRTGERFAADIRSPPTRRTRTMANVDFFLKNDGIDGESTDDKHKGTIDVDAWSWAEAQSAHSQAGTGLGSGKAKMEPFQFTAKVGKHSPKLALACANGEHIKKAV